MSSTRSFSGPYHLYVSSQLFIMKWTIVFIGNPIADTNKLWRKKKNQLWKLQSLHVFSDFLNKGKLTTLNSNPFCLYLKWKVLARSLSRLKLIPTQYGMHIHISDIVYLKNYTDKALSASLAISVWNLPLFYPGLKSEASCLQHSEFSCQVNLHETKHIRCWKLSMLASFTTKGRHNLQYTARYSTW